MRRSPLEHPVAVLRTAIGLGQKEFGKMVGRHWRTIQSIELGSLPLSAGLAERICDETGVHMNWLMNGDPEAPIIDERGLPWRKEAFFDVQGRKLLPGTVLGRHYPTDMLSATLAAACAAVVVATESKNVRSYMWRIVNGIAKSVEDLPAYPEVRQQFENITAHHFKNSAAGFDEMLAYALHRIRKWKEPRPKRATTKRKSS